MKVGFFNIYHGSHEFQQTIHLVLADMMIRSVRKAMPDVEIVQLTDEKSPVIVGVDRVRRLTAKEPMAVQCVTHYSQCVGNWLLVDTDVLVQKDVRHVFDEPFDVAVCDRDGTTTEGEGSGFELFEKMPHNIGIMFSRSPAFWLAVREKLVLMDEKKQQWMGNQYAACEVIAEGKFNVKVLKGTDYNCPPMNKEDRCTEASIVHFKGQMRKKMMLERFAEV